jgi:hypothetical protein
MLFYQILSFFAQLFLLPFFLRLLFRFHKIAFSNPIYLAILHFTNRFTYPLSQWIYPSKTIDWHAVFFIFIAMLFLVQLRSGLLLGQSLGLITASIIVFLESINRICVIYVAAGLLAHTPTLMNIPSNRVFLDIGYELTQQQVKSITFFLRQIPILRVYFLRWSFWVWVFCMLLVNLSLEHIILRLMYS